MHEWERSKVTEECLTGTEMIPLTLTLFDTQLA